MFSLEENAKAQVCLDKAMPVFKQVGKTPVQFRSEKL